MLRGFRGFEEFGGFGKWGRWVIKGEWKIENKKLLGLDKGIESL